VAYMNKQLTNIRFGLDGKNVDAFLMELGIRFHRTIYEHLQNFQYNSMGAVLAVCDVNEYRKCVKEFDIQVVNQLFDTLHSLCNLLCVVPDQVKEACMGDTVKVLPKAVLLSFVTLRSDYRTEKIYNHFK